MNIMNQENSEKLWKLPLYKIYTDDEDVNLITKIVKRGSNWAIGPEIDEFENAICDYVGVDYSAVLNSGTSALHASLLAFGLGDGDEILVPSFSFISTANSVLFVNATPSFVDIEEETLGLDPKLIEKSVTSSTKAIIPMDYGGMSCQISEIKETAENNNLLLIEDGAESLGSSVKGKKVGSGTIVWEARRMHARGEINYEEFMDLVAASAPSVGHCNTMGTASSMNSIAEALGMSLPGCAAIPAPYRERSQMAYDTGFRSVEIVNEDLKPSDIMTMDAFKNAIVTASAIGASTNAPPHIIAIAKQLNLDLNLNHWQDWGEKIPLLVNLQPAGEYLGEDYFQAGGVPALSLIHI